MKFAIGLFISLAAQACSSSGGGSGAHHGNDGGTDANGGAGGSSSPSSGGTSATGDGSANGGASTNAGGSSNGGQASSRDGGTADGGHDEYGPWAGGATYYKQFSHGPSSDPSFFPITVWLQDPSLAAQYQQVGINTYVGLWQGPDDGQLSALAAAKMPVACDQNATGLAHVADPTIVAWTQDDEPDNAQALNGGGYGPCISASTIESRYQAMKTADSTRPVFLNLGQGVAHDYIGWGSACAATHPGDYPDYLKGADIASFDIYPVNDTDADVAGKLSLVATGVSNLVKWTDGKKPVWNWIECTDINGTGHKPTPAQVKAEVWMSIVHGSMGIGYFVHQFGATEDDHALLDDAAMKKAVTAINQQIADLAPALNTPPITNGGTVTTTGGSVDMLVKRSAGATYLLSVEMTGKAGEASFSGLGRTGTATVLGETRTVTVTDGAFEDTFDPWGVHLYRID